MLSTENYSQAMKLKEAIESADAIILGAGAGLSASAGLEYGGERFKKYFADFSERYGYDHMYIAGFYNYPTLEEYWGYWSKHIYYNRYAEPAGEVYDNLKKLVTGKDYFVITTNADHKFQKAGFDKERLFYTQGDYGLFQCSKACHHVNYDNEEQIMAMLKSEDRFAIPSEMIPYCPKCGAPMTTNLRKDNLFIEDDGWHKAYRNYAKFLDSHKGKKILLLEMGIGNNTPVIIKYPFWELARFNKNATYACLNLYDAFAPKDIEARSIVIQDDITKIIACIM